MMKKQETDIVLRTRIITLFEEGYSQREISEKVDCPKSTVGDIIKKYKDTGSIYSKEGRGRKRKTTKREDRLIVNTAKKNRRLSASVLKKKLEN